jgi:hypothetical protein
MPFPTPTAGTVYQDSTTGTVKPVACPAHAAADRLLLVAGFDGNPTISSIDAVGGQAWVSRVSLPTFSSDGRLFVYEIVSRAAAAAASTVNVTLSASERGGAVIYKIASSHATQAMEVATSAPGANGATPDPPVLAPSWGLEDTLYVAAVGYNGNQSVTGYPTSYSGGLNPRPTSTGGTEAGCGVAYRELAAASENPGAFALSASVAHVVATLAVRPAESGSGGGGVPAPTDVTLAAAEVAAPAAGIHTAELVRSPAAPGILTVLQFEDEMDPGGDPGTQPDDPVREWLFNEGTGVTVNEESGTADDLAIVGDGGSWVTRTDPGFGAKAYRFNPAVRAETLITGGDLFPGPEYTIAVYSTLPPVTADALLAIGSTGATLDGAYLAPHASGMLHAGHSNAGLFDGEVSANPDATANALHWWVVTSTHLGGTQCRIRLYRDGALLAVADRPMLEGPVDRFTVANRYGGRLPAAPLTWAPPDTTGYTTRTITDSATTFIGLDDNVNYVIDQRVPLTRRVTMRGGKNVVWVGGEWNIATTVNGPTSLGREALAVLDSADPVKRAANAGRIIHLEGIWVHGYYAAGDVHLSCPTAVVRRQNCRTEQGMWAKNRTPDPQHPDTFQPYGGVARYDEDRCTDVITYQGFIIGWDPSVTTDTGTRDTGPVTIKRKNYKAQTDLANTELGESPSPANDTINYFVHCSRYFDTAHDPLALITLDQVSFVSVRDELTVGGTGTAGLGRASPYDGWAYTVTSELGRKALAFTNPRWASGSKLYEGASFAPGGGDWVPATVPGLNYISPGYS